MFCLGVRAFSVGTVCIGRMGSAEALSLMHSEVRMKFQVDILGRHSSMGMTAWN